MEGLGLKRVLLTAGLIGWVLAARAQGRETAGIYTLPPFERAVRCVRYFEGWHNYPEHWPYVGYGHRVLPDDRLHLPLTRKEGDALLRADLYKLCSMFRGYGRDSLLLATLAYNVGCGTLFGNSTTPKSIILQKLDRGDRNIRSDYLRYCHYKGKYIPSIRKRRIVEFHLLFVK